MSDAAIRFGPDKSLVGVVTSPESEQRQACGVVLMNAGILHRVGPNRLNVKIARDLAELGFASLRFDYSGMGDSEFRDERIDLESRRVDELGSAMSALGEISGVENFLLLGVCSGALESFLAASRDDRIVGIALLETFHMPTLRYHVTRALSPEKWRGVLSGDSHMVERFKRRMRARMARGFPKADDGPRPVERNAVGWWGSRAEKRSMLAARRAIARRGTRVLYVYAAENEARFSYVLERSGDRVFASSAAGNERVEFVGEADHTFTLVASQQRLLRIIRDWVRVPADGGIAASGDRRGAPAQ